MAETIKKAYESFEETLNQYLPVVSPELVGKAVRAERNGTYTIVEADISYKFGVRNKIHKKKDELPKIIKNLEVCGTNDFIELTRRIRVSLPLTVGNLLKLSKDKDIELIQ